MTKQFAILIACAICFTVIALFGVAPEVRAFDEPDLLARQIRPIAINGGSFEQVLDILTSDYGIPLGIELVNEQITPARKIELTLPQTNLKHFLDSLIAKDPRYTWKLEGGVIHFRPSTARDALLTTLLDTKITHFSFTGGATTYRIFSDILMLPEIGSQLVVADVAPIFIVIGSMQRVEKGIFFEESNLTLKELLHKIVLKTNIKRWVLTRWGKNSQFIILRS
jgi:hypothetical protein